MNSVSIGTSLCQFNNTARLNQNKMYEIFSSCDLYTSGNISRFIRHCIRVKKYFHGEYFKVEYMREAIFDYDENVAEL